MSISTDHSWKNEGGLWQDPGLQRVKNSPLHYRPQPIRPEECLEPLVLTLRGPRRVGKTVALKLLIAELVEHHGVDPQRISWTSLDSLRTLAQMEAHLLELQRRDKPKMFFIDEVTAVVGWQKVIKKFRDNGVLADTCVVLTGSSAHDLKASAERMAGRRGGYQVYDRVLLPMSYEIFRQQTAASVDSYLSVGGFPFRVEQFIHSQRNREEWRPDFGMPVFDDVFFYEINRRKLSRNIAIEIIARLSQIRSSATSYESFAKAISVTKDTARNYLDALGEAFLLVTYYSYDASKSRVAPKKDKKFHWVDPSLGFFAESIRQGEALDEATRAEAVVGTELLRRHESRLWEGLAAPRNVFTWKSKAGNEIDFLIVDRSQKRLVPVEVKYQNTIVDWDFQVMEKAFGKGIIVTKNKPVQRTNTCAVPIEEFLLKSAGQTSVLGGEFAQ